MMKTGDLFASCVPGSGVAEASRDTGIARAIDHATQVDENWRHAALLWVIRYARATNGQFLTEDVREFAYTNGGFQSPADGRAWGQVIRDAARKGIVVQDGTLRARSSNLSPKVAWRRAP